jgi:hypothetical protein
MRKTRNKSITKRFNLLDIQNWQHEANKKTGGNLTLWIENTLNKAVKTPVKVYKN